MLVQDYNAVASKLPHLLSARVRQGLPSKLRGLIWQSMSQASSTYLETMYTQLVKEPSPYERIIQRDLARTFPQVDMFKEDGGKGQEMLGNILKAYSLYDPHVGYCQGLGFLVGPLLMNVSCLLHGKYNISLRHIIIAPSHSLLHSKTRWMKKRPFAFLCA